MKSKNKPDVGATREAREGRKFDDRLIQAARLAFVDEKMKSGKNKQKAEAAWAAEMYRKIYDKFSWDAIYRERAALHEKQKKEQEKNTTRK